MSIFKNIDDSIKMKVQLKNGALMESKRKTIVVMETKKGTRLIKEVFLVPNVKKESLEHYPMMEKSYTFHFNEDTCVRYDNRI